MNLSLLSLTRRSAKIFLLILFLQHAAGVSVINGTAPVSDTRAFRLVTPQEDGWTALAIRNGVLFVWNRADMSFSLSVKGRDIQPMKDPEHIFFVVDGIVLQIQSLPISNFAANAKKEKLDDRSILAAHRDWESKFLQDEVLHSKLSVTSTEKKLANGAGVLVWQFDLPDRYKSRDAKGQMYVTAVARDYVVLLNGVVSSAGAELPVQQFLLSVMETLTVSPNRFDIKKLQEEIRKLP